MRLYLREQIIQMEQQAADMGISTLILMENAAIALSNRIESTYTDRFDRVKPAHIRIYVGKGQNGGDGLAIARHLVNRGARIELVMVHRPTDGPALVNLKIAENMGIPMLSLSEVSGMCNIAVDALLGTGLKGAITDTALIQAIHQINTMSQTVYSADIPSGIIADTGEVEGACVKAHHTVTFGFAKPGLFLYPGAHYAGEVTVADISLPQSLCPKCQTFTIPSPSLPPLKWSDHKYTVGCLLMVAGSPNMSGALILAAKAAQKAGAGIITTLCDTHTKNVIEPIIPEAIKLTSPPDNFEKYDAIVMGPGMGVDNFELFETILENASCPVILDADAITMLSQMPHLLKSDGQYVVTPHMGEFKRLTTLTPQEFCRRHQNIICVLKGANTRVYLPDDTIHINTTGNPGMATAGSGDVLSGIMGALACKLPLPHAVTSAVHIHGAAGDSAAAQYGQYAITASDIISRIFIY